MKFTLRNIRVGFLGSETKELDFNPDTEISASELEGFLHGWLATKKFGFTYTSAYIIDVRIEVETL